MNSGMKHLFRRGLLAPAMLTLGLLFGIQAAHATTSYIESSTTFNWISTSGQTLIVTGASGGTWSSGANCTTSANGPYDGASPDDDITWPIPLGFTFNFGGVNYTSVQIMANGRLEFGSNNQCGYGGPYVQIPTTTGNTVSTVTSIIPYSMDFDPDPVDAGGGTTCTSPGCGVYYGTGTASNGLSYFVITWLANPGYAAQTPTYTVQAILYSDGSFEFQYQNNTSDPPLDSNGNLPAIGWEIDTSHYYQHPYSNLASLNNTAILYSPSLLDHFVITVPSSGTCSAQPISVTAADSSGNAITTFTDTITVSDVGNFGNNFGQFTAGSPTPYGTLTGSGSSPVTYAYNAADLGTVALNFLDTTDTSATIWVTDNTTGVTSSSSTITYPNRNFFNITPLNPTVSPSYSAVAGMPYEFQIELVSSNCGVVTNYAGNNGGNKALNVSITRDSSDPGGTAPTVIDAVGGNSASAAIPNSPSTTSVTLYFGGRRRGNPPPGGTAYFYLNTTDVGKYTLNLTDSSNTGQCRPSCTGSSSTITVRPFGVVVTNVKNAGGTANPGATTATGSIFTGAGQNFSATVTGVQWQSGDDANNDGIPDDYTALASSPVTASYGWATALAPCPTSTQMGSTGPNCSYAPSTGVLGTVSNGTLAQASFSGGSGTDSTLQYSEVGSFMLSATATNFLNTSGVDVTGYSSAIGRFTPDHFDVVNALGSASCTPSFAYSGQPFYQTTVTAYNALGNAAGNVTHNYSTSNGFGKTVTIGDATNGTTNFTNNTFASMASGTETLTSTTTGDVTYTFPAVETAPTTLTLRATDTDGVSSATSGSEPSVLVRSGRLRIAQANGPEFVNLAVPIYLESYQSIGGGDYGWVTTTDDTCTTPVTSDFSLGTFTGSLTAGNTLISNISNVSPGIYTLTIGKPGVTGSAILTGDLSTKTWLYSDWAKQNVLTKPTALISFGIYTGNPHQIYIH